MHIERILILDDSREWSEVVASVLRELGYAIEVFDTVAKARAGLRDKHYDLALLDVNLPDGKGTDLLRESGDANGTVFMMMSGQATLESAIEAMRFGAANYLIKPFTADQLEVALRQIEKWKQLNAEKDYFRGQAAGEPSATAILGASEGIRRVHELVRQAGPTDATVLIHGESGTGKELVAQALVDASPRSKTPYIKVNCTAMPDNLMESEFFGHERGSFTGAVQKRVGRFEMADGGTILLDEVSELPLPLQAKLLRVLQEREFERVGGNRTIKVNTRVLATTNRDMAAFVKEKRFREDLYYRLNVVPIAMPPLRERAGDVAVLLDHFLARFAQRHRKPLPQLPAATRETLLRAPWPGNIRELQNCVERAVILSTPSRELTPSDFGIMDHQPAPSDDGAANGDTGGDLSIANMEARLIQAAMRRTGGNVTQAAKLLGISQRTLHYRLAQAKT